MEGVMQWQSATPIPALAKRSKGKLYTAPDSGCDMLHQMTFALDPDWERKQRLREYRVASRREKRNRKADEKKQRKLNATILRRMVRVVAAKEYSKLIISDKESRQIHQECRT